MTTTASLSKKNRMSSEGSSDEFFEKFEGYTIPKKKKAPPEPESKMIPATNLLPCPVPHPDATPKPAFNREPRKVSKRSATEFLKDDCDVEGSLVRNEKDPLGLEPLVTYGEAKKSRHTLAEEWFLRFDGEMPQFVVDQCTDGKCEICQVKFDSRPVAKTHYAGKPHTRKCIQAMQKWHDEDPERNKIPLLLQQEVSSSSENNSGSLDPFGGPTQIMNDKFCSICNIELTSKIVADSHYQGKNHAKQLRKIAVGSYVPMDKHPFPTLKKPKVIDIDSSKIWADKEARQGSGNQFFCLGCHLHFSCGTKYKAHLASSEHKEKASCNPTQVSEEAESAFKLTVVPSNESIDQMLSSLRSNPKAAFDCSLCQVRCSSQDMLTTHLNGKQHRKKLALSESGGSGGFRCDVCNVETTDMNGLQMHLLGKKHLKKANAQ